MTADTVKTRRTNPLRTPTNLGSNATRDISAALTTLLADMFALYIKTKNFHWHMSGPHFRDYHLMLDEQSVAEDGPACRGDVCRGDRLQSDAFELEGAAARDFAHLKVGLKAGIAIGDQAHASLEGMIPERPGQ